MAIPSEAVPDDAAAVSDDASAPAMMAVGGGSAGGSARRGWRRIFKARVCVRRWVSRGRGSVTVEVSGHGYVVRQTPAAGRALGGEPVRLTLAEVDRKGAAPRFPALKCESGPAEPWMKLGELIAGADIGNFDGRSRDRDHRPGL